MPDFSGEIKNFVAGDDLQIIRTITNVPSGAALTKAWFTVKLNQDDSDANAIFQKEITTADVAGTGQITDDGGGDQSAAVRFDLTSADTLLLDPDIAYFYDVQVLTDGGAVYTPETGKMIAKAGITVTEA